MRNRLEIRPWVASREDNHCIINKDAFIKRMLGSVSYFRRANDALFPVDLEPKVCQ